MRLVQTAVENAVLLRRIEAIRRYYVTLDPAVAEFFTSPSDTTAAALASSGLRTSDAEIFFTSASMIAAINSIVVGSGAALLLDSTGVPLTAAVVVGVAAALLAYGLRMLVGYRRVRRAMT
ncbi:MAG TPA: hypothetical protein VHJ18_17285 [Streptosporangiaceae bacterium]|nr:hypothetical protein [Streptosporangiaceae bacterium]